jgi:hypothetical protein
MATPWQEQMFSNTLIGYNWWYDFGARRGIRCRLPATLRAKVR